MRVSIGLAVLAVLVPSLGDAGPSSRPSPHSWCFASEIEGGGSAAPARPLLLTGYGTGGFQIRRSVDEAQAWFDYGMQTGHAFAHSASIAAFKEAQRIDPTCAMCVWGEAWASGPTINFDVDAAKRKDLLDLSVKAAVLAEDGPEKERLLAAALKARYTGAGPAADLAFAKAMDELARRYPDDSEIAVLTADAFMIRASLHDDNAGMPRAIELLEGVLKRSPDDTGAIHFYIHATEVMGRAGDALTYAERLGRLAPSASHLVHMPSHTYYRVGRYEEAATANRQAVDIDKAYPKRAGLGVEVWDLSYHGHNVVFGVGGAMMSGDAETALGLAAHIGELEAKLKAKPGRGGQIPAAFRYYALGRYGAPEAVLAAEDPGPALPYLRAMWRYARGEALARKGNAAGVRAEARAVVLSAADLKAAGDLAPTTRALVEIAHNVLLGRAAMLENRPDLAARAYETAANIQRAQFREQGDPPLWWYPVGRSVAAAQLRAGRYEQAAATAEGVLKAWPADPMSLTVLAMSERALGRTAEAEAHFTAARLGWSGDLTRVGVADI